MATELSEQTSFGLPGLSVRRPWLVTVLNLLIAIAGIAALLGIEVRELPDVDRPTVMVRAMVPGASPETMDAEVTRLLEGAIARVSGVKDIGSSSEENNSRIWVQFEPGIDVDQAASDVREAISRIERDLPDATEELSVFKADSNGEEIMRIAVRSDVYAEAELARIIEKEIIPNFISLPGVADVPLFGDRSEVLRIILDPLRLTSFGLTVSDVRAVLQGAPLDIPAGSFRSGDQQLLVRADAAVTREEDIAALIIRDNVRLKDVASVAFTPADSQSLVRLDGEMVVGLGIIRQAGSNTIEISEGVRSAMERINQRYSDVELSIISDNAVFIKGAVREVLVTLAISIMVVIATIRLFSGSMRLTLIPAIAIPVSLLGTMAASWILGFSINILTLLALVLGTGLIVDDAIVVLESIQRRRSEGLASSAAAVVGTRKVFFAVIATTAVLIAVFIPIAFLPGTAGRLFREFGLVLAVGVAISSLVALTLVPAAMAKLPTKAPSHRRLDALGNALLSFYGRTLDRVLRHPIKTAVLCATLAVLAGSLYTQLQRELLPTEDRGDINILAVGPDGVGLNYSERQGDRLENILVPLKDQGEIASLYTVVGRWDPNIVFITARLAPWSDRDRSQQDIADELTPILAQLPGVNTRVFGANSLNLRNAFGGGVRLALLGSDYDQIFAAARTFSDAAQDQILGVQQARLGYDPSQPQLSLQIDRQRASDLNISLTELSQTLRVMVDGVRVVDLNVDDQTVPIILEAGSQKIRDPNDLVNLYIRTQNNDLVPLSSLVTLEEHGVAAQLDRVEQRRAISIDIALKAGFTLQETLDDLMDLAERTLPPGITLVPQGEAAALNETNRDTLVTYGLALLIVFLVLVAQFESLSSALVIMTIVPFGLAAAVFALYMTGTSLNIYSQVGLVMLIGLIAKNGILLVEFADQLRDEGKGVSAAITEAAQVRLRPIVMTLMSTVLGALPLIMASGPGAEARSAVGWVVFGGLGLAALFTLYLTPVVYLGLARFSKPRSAARLRLEGELKGI